MQQKRIDEILNSLDEIKGADAPAFFETRLLASLEKRLTKQNNNWFQITYPVWAMASLILLLCANLYMVSFNKKESINVAENRAIKTTASIQTFASEYQLNNSAFDY